MIDFFFHCFITLGFLVSFCWFPLYLQFHLIWVPVFPSFLSFALHICILMIHIQILGTQSTTQATYFFILFRVNHQHYEYHGNIVSTRYWCEKKECWLSFIQTLELALPHQSTKRWENENLCRVKKIGFVFTSSIFRSQSKWNVPYERWREKNRQRQKFPRCTTNK